MFYTPPYNEINALKNYYRERNSTMKKKYRYPYRLFERDAWRVAGSSRKTFRTSSECESELFNDLIDNQPSGMHLPALLGKKEGIGLVHDLAGGHLLVAGMTQHGKTTWLRSTLISLLHWSHPEYLRICVADAKCLGFTAIRDIANLARSDTRLENSMEQIELLLKQLKNEMNRRMDMMDGTNFDNVKAYNAHLYRRRDRNAKNKILPYIVFIFDEYADFIAESDSDHKAILNTLVSKGLGLGIHVILTMQNPYAEVLKGMIKGNLNRVMSFRLKTRVQEQVVFGSCAKENNTLSLPPGHFQEAEGGNRVIYQGYYSTPKCLYNAVVQWKRHGLDFAMFPKESKNEL